MYKIFLGYCMLMQALDIFFSITASDDDIPPPKVSYFESSSNISKNTSTLFKSCIYFVFKLLVAKYSQSEVILILKVNKCIKTIKSSKFY